MGRRKIEIKAIKDDRNRSVTFLKRKGGLFKKAHELSVLCSVDVAVIIFGNNKKLYEYSSSDLGEILQRHSYYGGANEHKGPADFNGKGDDDDDDEVGSDHGPSHHGSVEPQMMPPHFQNQNPAFSHIRHHTPSASPPIPNGVFPHHPQHPQQRQHTPQPPQIGSRPSSRNDPRRPGLGQHMGPQGPHPPPQNGFAYMPNPAIYQPQNGPGMPPHPHGIPQHMQGPPHGMPHQGPPPPQYQYPAPPPQQHPQYQQQVQQIQIEEQRRSSAPPGFIKQERPPSRQTASPPQPQQLQQPQQPEPEQRQQPSPQQNLVAEPVKRMSIKSRSIFTPIDETRSILSQHWVPSTSNTEASNAEPATSNRSQSVDVGAVSRNKPPSPPPPRQQTHIKNRVSMSSVSSVPESGFTPPSRTNSAQLSAAGGKRPVLKVQIPDEPSDGGSATADSASPHDSTGQTGSLPTHRKNSGSHSSGVVLPPPSPSAGGTLLSAGASGPPNPFARPHPVAQPSQTSQGSNSNSNNMNIDTPVSALPSRFMTDQFLPSPSSFFNGSGWDFNRNGDSNTLASPLNFATPVVGSGPSFLREDSGERGPSAEKRKSPEGEGGDAKRARIDT